MTPTARGEYNTPAAEGDNRLAMLTGEKMVPAAVSVTAGPDGDGLALGEMLGLILPEGLIDAETLGEIEGEMLAETLGEMD